MTPASHDGLLKAVAVLHELFPDWRLGQLIANLATAAGATAQAAIWDLEDEQLLNAAKRLIESNAARDSVRSSHPAGIICLPGSRVRLIDNTLARKSNSVR